MALADRTTFAEAYNKCTWAKSHLHLADVASERAERLAHLRWALAEAERATDAVAKLLRDESYSSAPTT